MPPVRVQINPVHPEPHKIKQATSALRGGGVIAYPTDTVYGLGCDANNKRAVERVYSIKGIPKTQPLALLCADLSNISNYGIVDNHAYRIMRRLLPGPYCFILRSTREVPKILLSRRKTIGIRVPDHAVVRALMRELGSPLISTTAAWEGETLSEPDEMKLRFPGLELILDAGDGGSTPSTVVDLTSDEPEVIRLGAGPVEGLQ